MPRCSIGSKAKNNRHITTDSKEAEFSDCLADMLRREELIDQCINTFKASSFVSATYFKIEAKSKHTQSIEYGIEILNMKEYHLEDITAIMAFFVMKIEIW